MPGFTDTELVIDPLFRLRQERHEYANVTDIRTAPAFVALSGRRVERREYVIQFADGATWNTNYEPSEADAGRIAEIVDFVRRKSGVSITEVETLGQGEIR